MAIDCGPATLKAAVNTRFKSGVSGNTTVPRGLGQAGRLRAAIADDIAPIIAVVTAKALAGDLVACGLLLARAVPPLRPSDPAGKVCIGKGTVTQQSRKVIALMAANKIDMAQGSAIVAALASVARMTTIDELVNQVELIEQEMKGLRDAATRKNV